MLPETLKALAAASLVDQGVSSTEVEAKGCPSFVVDAVREFEDCTMSTKPVLVYQGTHPWTNRELTVWGNYVAPSCDL